MFFKRPKIIPSLGIALAATLLSASAFAQAPTPTPESLSRYLDQIGGMTADAAVALALDNNGEILALRKEVESARALARQARLRANPSIGFDRREQVGGPDNNTVVGASLPLELGGRRSARTRVAEAELDVSEHRLADSERLLAGAVRAKFGEALAQTLRLKTTEDLVDYALQEFRLIQSRVVEGKIAPLDEGMAAVELNRIRSLLENESGKTEVVFFELRNLLGLPPDEPLRLRGSIEVAIRPSASLAEDVQRALRTRPDLLAFRSEEAVANAKIEKSRADGRLDARISADYQRNDFGFPVRGIDQTGALRPVQDVFHSVRVGVTFEVPVLNANQGAIESAVALAEAAEKRREFAELIVRREVSAAHAKYESASRALEIFRVRVHGQANSNLEVVRQTYEFGARNLIDYLNEQRRVLDIENEFIAAQLAVYLAKIELQRSINAPELTNK